MAESFLDVSAVELSARIAARAISSRELVTLALDRIEAVNPVYNAIVSLRDREVLLREAAERDEHLARGGTPRGPLHGFPHAVKDTASVVGLRTTLGSPLLADAVASHDAYFVERLRAAGVVIIGKTNVPEMGLGSHTYNPVFGATGNATDPSRSAGGSSGGAAVALALGMVPVADGSDYMGSLRNPAGWNGIMSLRPSIGVVALGPSDDNLVRQLVTEGPMARNIGDLGLLLSVMAGPDRRVPESRALDPTSFAGVAPIDLGRIRLGWLADVIDGLPIEPGVIATCRTALDDWCRSGCRVADVALGIDRSTIWSTFLTLRHTTSAGGARSGPHAALLAARGARGLIKDEMRWEIDGADRFSAVDVHRAVIDATRLRRRLIEMFELVDAIVMPTAQCFPFPIEQPWPARIAGIDMDTYHRWMEIAVPVTLSGLPTLTLPAGRGPDGLPMGLQVIGPPGSDRSLLGLGAGLEPYLS